MAKRGTALQMNIIELLVQGKSRSDISKELKCCLKTIDDVKGNPELKRLYYEKCNDQIETLMPIAIKRLKGILEDNKQQGSVHVAAIREVLDRSHLKELLDATDKNKNINISVTYE